MTAKPWLLRTSLGLTYYAHALGLPRIVMMCPRTLRRIPTHPTFGGVPAEASAAPFLWQIFLFERTCPWRPDANRARANERERRDVRDNDLRRWPDGHGWRGRKESCGKKAKKKKKVRETIKRTRESIAEQKRKNTILFYKNLAERFSVFERCPLAGVQ